MIRRPLNPVSRYQERLKRAVSANSMNKTAASSTTKLNPGKMPVMSSPAPRSPARQERPPADQPRNAKRNQRGGRKGTSSSLRDENINQFHAISHIADTFDMSAGVFLAVLTAIIASALSVLRQARYMASTCPWHR